MTNRPMPTATVRTAIAIGYRNNNLIADKVLPYEKVNGEKFTYLKHTLANGYTVPDTKVGRKSDPNTVSFSAEEKTDKVEAYGLSDFVPQSDVDASVENYDPINRSITGIMDLVLLDREVRVANMVNDEATYGNNKKVLTDSEKFTADNGANPVDVIDDAIKNMLVAPTHMLFSYDIWSFLRKDDAITRAIYGDGHKGKLAKTKDVAELFGLNEILVGQAHVNTAKKGKAVNIERCWENNIILFNQNPASSDNGTFGFTARFGNRVVDTQEVKKKGLTGGIDIWAGEFVKEVVCSEAHGYLIKNCI